MSENIKTVLLLKYGEVVLKGLNRASFEQIMMRDVKARMAKCGNYSIERAQSTISISPCDSEAQDNMDMALCEARKVFGIVSVSVATQMEKDMDIILSLIADCTREKLSKASTFKVEAKRSDKQFALKSPEICALCGGKLLESFPHLKVDVNSPDVTVRVEIRDYHAYIHCGALSGAGGMPQGSAGKGLLLLSGGIDSPVAGYLMAKRGVMINALHFESYPYTSEQAREKVVELATLMQDSCGPLRLSIVSLTHIQEEIKKNCNEDYFTLILRRFMVRIATRVAQLYKAKAIITGESLGQVASQTMGAIITTNDAAGEIPILRPLISFDKEQIITIARKIGTFETSILPYEDCCTVFTPKHPVTNPKLENIISEENRLDVEGLINEAMDTIFAVRI